LEELTKAKLVTAMSVALGIVVLTAMSVALGIVVLCWMAGMKRRHAAALALVGWYLMVPLFLG
jgi:hypothetical protein